MAGPIAKTQPKSKELPQREGELQPDVSRGYDDVSPHELAKPQPQAGKPHLADDETHPAPGMSQNINTGEGTGAKPTH